MAEEKLCNDYLILENRKLLKISGVIDVDSFDDETITALTSLGELLISGKELHISRLDIEAGDLVVDGEISSMDYISEQNKRMSFFSKLIK